MKRLVVFIFFLSTAFSCLAQEDQPFLQSRGQIESMFQKLLEEEGWDSFRSFMLFSYYFQDEDPAKLELLLKQLYREGYELVAICRKRNSAFYMMKVDQIEKHTVESLFKRNKYLAEVAGQYDIGSYDGWKMGLIVHR